MPRIIKLRVHSQSSPSPYDQANLLERVKQRMVQELAAVLPPRRTIHGPPRRATSNVELQASIQPPGGVRVRSSSPQYLAVPVENPIIVSTLAGVPLTPEQRTNTRDREASLTEALTEALVRFDPASPPVCATKSKAPFSPIHVMSLPPPNPFRCHGKPPVRFILPVGVDSASTGVEKSRWKKLRRRYALHWDSGVLAQFDADAAGKTTGAQSLEVHPSVTAEQVYAANFFTRWPQEWVQPDRLFNQCSERMRAWLMKGVVLEPATDLPGVNPTPVSRVVEWPVLPTVDIHTEMMKPIPQ